MRRLQEYERFKRAAEEHRPAAAAGARCLAGVRAAARSARSCALLPQVTLQEMLLAFKDVVARAQMFAHHHVQRERLSVRERMSDILARLGDSELPARSCALFRPEEGRMGVTVTFVAILELMREGLIDIVQTEPYAPLHVRAAGPQLHLVGGEADATNGPATPGPTEPGALPADEDPVMNDSYLRNVVEAALLAAGRPLHARRTCSSCSRSTRARTAQQLRAALGQLAAEYAGRGIELKETASGYRIQVRQRACARRSRACGPSAPARYSRALLETLALIAYRQPITRAEIEAVRGVAVNPNIIGTVLERSWVRVVGHRDVPGPPGAARHHARVPRLLRPEEPR